MSAAPSSSINNESRHRIGNEIAKKLGKLKNQLQCAIKTIDEVFVITGSYLEVNYDDFKAAINAVLTKDVKECNQIQDVKNKFR